MNSKLKVFVGRNLSFVEAPWQPFTRTNRSPHSPFLIVEMVYWVFSFYTLNIFDIYIYLFEKYHFKETQHSAPMENRSIFAEALGVQGLAIVYLLSVLNSLLFS